MNPIYTADSLSAADRLCSTFPGNEVKAALAAMVTEAFINGMNARDLLDAASSPARKRTAADIRR